MLSCCAGYWSRDETAKASRWAASAQRANAATRSAAARLGGELLHLRAHDEIAEIHFHVVRHTVFPVAHGDLIGRRDGHRGVVEESDIDVRAGQRGQPGPTDRHRRLPV